MSIDSVLHEIQPKVNFQQMTLDLQRLVHKIQLDMINTKKRSDGYCVSFIIPEKEVLHLFNVIEPGLTDKISTTFKVELAIPENALMLNSPYYHILLFLILLGLKNNNESMAKSAMNLMNFRLYNGRRFGSINCVAL